MSTVSVINQVRIRQMHMEGPNFQDLNRLVANDEFELQSHILHTLRLLRPQSVKGYEKARFGCPGDGGYINIDDFAGIDTAVSLGIDYNITWDRDIADRGLTVYQFDGTVDDPAPDDPRMIFEKKMIGAHVAPDIDTLEAIIGRLDKKLERPNLILKMDIECGEWAAIEATSLEAISRFSQITCELHNFAMFHDLNWRQGFFRCLRKLSKFYAPIHVHGNNYGGWSFIANVPIPNVIEVTFAHRTIYEFEDSDEIFPGPLDTPCNGAVPDMYLGRFAY